MLKMKKATSLVMTFFIMLLCVTTVSPIASAEAAKTVSVNVANTVDGKYWVFNGAYENNSPFRWTNDTSTLINANTQMRYGVTAEQAGYYELSFDYLSLYAANHPTYGNTTSVFFSVMVGDETVIDIQKLPLTDIAASTSSTAMDNAVSYTCPTLIPLKAGENVVKICIYQGTQTVDGVQISSMPMAVRTTDSFSFSLVKPTLSINVANTVDGKYWAFNGTYEHSTPFRWTNDTGTLINNNIQMRYGVTAEQAGYYELSFDYLSFYAANDPTYGNNTNVFFRVMVGDETVIDIQKLPLTNIAASTSSTDMDKAVSYTCPTLIPLKAGENVVKICIYQGAQTVDGVQSTALPMAVRTTDSFRLTLQRPIITIGASEFSNRSGFSANIANTSAEPDDGDKLSFGNEAIYFDVNCEEAGYYDVSADVSTGNAATYITVATTEPEQVTTNILTAKVKDNTAFNQGQSVDLPTYSIGTGLYLKKGVNTVVLTSSDWTRLESISFVLSEQQKPSLNKEVVLAPLAYAKAVEGTQANNGGYNKWRYGFAQVTLGNNDGMEFVLNLVPGTYKLTVMSRTSDAGATVAVDLNKKRILSGISVPSGPQKYLVLSENISIGKAGENTLKVINETSTNAVFCGIIVEKLGEYVGPSVDDEIPSIEDGTYQETLETPVTLQSDASYSMKIYSERALSYEFSLNFADVTEDTIVDVYVDSEKQFGDIEVTEASNTYLGNIALQRGNNTITVEAASGEATFDALAFNVVDSFENHEMLIDVTEGSQIPAKKITNYIDTNAVFMADDYVEFDLYSEKERIVLISFNYAAQRSTSLYSVAINGVTKIENAGLDYTGTNSAWTYENVMMPDSLLVPEGECTVRLSISNDQIRMKNMILEAPENELMINDLSLVNEAGGRLPYTFADGTKARAAITLQCFGVPSESNKRLIVAQYQKGIDGKTRMVGAQHIVIDPTDLIDGERKTIYTDTISLKADGVVKAFLWDATTYAPLQEVVLHEELPEIFVASDIETLKNQEVSYQLSTAVMKNETEYYGDYSDGVVKSIFYDGYNGTKVFAYMGIPESASADNPVPAVVCIHGGGGSADKEWVKKWNDLGVAAIAMDMYGGGPEAYVEGTGENAGNKMQKHPYAGIKPYEDFSGINNGKSAGMYQTVANAMYAYNLLAAMPEIDATKIGITGISWGGVTTTTVIGVDDRFCFAVPVYGCGYLDECRTYFSTSYFQKAGATLAWDPANFAVKSNIPVMYVNSDEDAHFSLNSTTNTAAITQNGFMSIHNGLAHSMSHGYNIEQVYTFAMDIFSSGKDNFMRINSAKIIGDNFEVTCSLPTGVTAENATVYYITDAKLPWTGQHYGGTALGIDWKSVTGSVNGANITATLPANATFAYMSVTDNAGNIISTGLLECSSN